MSALSIERFGAGADLALVHGWGIGKAVWEGVVGSLAQRFRVHLIELAGYGKAPGNEASFAQTTQQLVESLPAGSILCGWSLGGLLAQHAAWLAPQQLSRLVLVASTPSFTQRGDWPQAQPRVLVDSFSAALADDAAGTRQRFFALHNHGDSRRRACTRVFGKLAATSPVDRAALGAGLDWLRDVDLRQQSQALTVPTLLIHGAADALIPMAAAQWLHGQLADAQLAVFAGAGHAPFINDPGRFVRLVGDYCDASAAA